MSEKIKRIFNLLIRIFLTNGNSKRKFEKMELNRNIQQIIKGIIRIKLSFKNKLQKNFLEGFTSFNIFSFSYNLTGISMSNFYKFSCIY